MDKLDEDCKKWLDKFSKEYINASFTHKDPLHSKEQQLEIYRRNNSRNNCVLSRQKAYGHLNYLEENGLSNQDHDDMTEEEADYKTIVSRLDKD